VNHVGFTVKNRGAAIVSVKYCWIIYLMMWALKISDGALSGKSNKTIISGSMLLLKSSKRMIDILPVAEYIQEYLLLWGSLPTSRLRRVYWDTFTFTLRSFIQII